MSHFLIIAIDDDGTSTHALSTDISRIFKAHELSAELKLISAKEVEARIADVAFACRGEYLIVFSLIADSGTADELISPYYYLDDWLRCVELLLTKLEISLKDLMRENGKSRILLIFSEGVDDAYDEVVLNVKDFKSFILDTFRNEERVPSLSVIINS